MNVAYQNGIWKPRDQVGIAPDDVGFRQGVVAVERLRTYGRRVFEPHAHLDRWHHTTAGLSIDPAGASMIGLTDELIKRNPTMFQQHGEISIAWLATPGDASGPTLILHADPIDRTRSEQRIASGQAVCITDVVAPPAESFPRSWKVRNRLHYYLADMAAKDRQPSAIGAIRDADGSVLDTSVCSLAVVVEDHVVSPPPDRLLRSVTQTVLERIAAGVGIRWQYRPIRDRDLHAATEVLLMGTDTGLWFANSVDGFDKPSPSPTGIYHRLLSCWRLAIG